jgi:prepilin-type N-terminal cleavage/methylation domain-containing protein
MLVLDSVTIGDMDRRLRTQAGFTLVELLVAMLIIAILIALAAPSFLGQSVKAKDSHADQALGIALKEAQILAVANGGKFPYVDGTRSGADDLATQIWDSNIYPFHDVEAGMRTPEERTVSPGPDDVLVDAASTPDHLILYDSSDAPYGPSNKIRECTMTAGGAETTQIVCEEISALQPVGP